MSASVIPGYASSRKGHQLHRDRSSFSQFLPASNWFRGQAGIWPVRPQTGVLCHSFSVSLPGAFCALPKLEMRFCIRLALYLFMDCQAAAKLLFFHQIFCLTLRIHILVSLISCNSALGYMLLTTSVCPLQVPGPWYAGYFL